MKQAFKMKHKKQISLKIMLLSLVMFMFFSIILGGAAESLPHRTESTEKSIQTSIVGDKTLGESMDKNNTSGMLLMDLLTESVYPNKDIFGLIEKSVTPESAKSTFGVTGKNVDSIITSLEVRPNSIMASENITISLRFDDKANIIQEGDYIDITWPTLSEYGSNGIFFEGYERKIPLLDSQDRHIADAIIKEDSAKIIFTKIGAELRDVNGFVEFEAKGRNHTQPMFEAHTGNGIISAGSFRKTVTVSKLKAGEAKFHHKNGVMFPFDVEHVYWWLLVNNNIDTVDKEVEIYDKVQEGHEIDKTSFIINVYDVSYVTTTREFTQPIEKFEGKESIRDFLGKYPGSSFDIYPDLKQFLVKLPKSFVDKRHVQIIYKTKIIDENLREFINTSKVWYKVNGKDDSYEETFKVKNIHYEAGAEGTEAGELKIHKVTRESGKDVSGVIFELIRTDGYISGSDRSIKIVTDDAGIASIKKLPPGHYILKEIFAPDWIDFNKDLSKEYEFDIHEGDLVGIFYKIYNKERNPKISINGEKVWKGDSSHISTRPQKVIIRLFADNIEKEFKEVTAEDSWKWSFINLDKNRLDGTPIEYTIKEDPVPNYETIIEKDSVGNYKVINKYNYVPPMWFYIDKCVGNETYNKKIKEGILGIEIKGTGENSSYVKNLKFDLARDYIKYDDGNLEGLKIDIPLDMKSGIYEITETQAPNGYIKTDKPIKVNVNKKQLTVTLLNDDGSYKNTLFYRGVNSGEITLYDPATIYNLQKDSMQFYIAKYEGITKNRTIIKKGKLGIEVKGTGENSSYRKELEFDLSKDYKLYGDGNIYEGLRIDISSTMKSGVYELRETFAPQGYIKTDKIYRVDINQEQRKIWYIDEAGNKKPLFWQDEYQGSFTKATLYNPINFYNKKKLPMEFYIKKVEGEKGNTTLIDRGKLGLKLKGIDSNNSSYIKNIIFDLNKDYEEYMTISSNKLVKGLKIEVPLDMPSGRYELTETMAPEGYSINREKKYKIRVEHENNMIYYINMNEEESNIFRRDIDTDKIVLLSPPFPIYNIKIPPMEIYINKYEKNTRNIITFGKLGIQIKGTGENSSYEKNIEFDLSKDYKTYDDGFGKTMQGLKIEITNEMKSGVYEIVESIAPTGYNKTDKIHRIKINQEDRKIWLINDLGKELPLYWPSSIPKIYGSIGFYNAKAEYPKTGGIGIAPFILIGLSLIVISVKLGKRRLF